MAGRGGRERDHRTRSRDSSREGGERDRDSSSRSGSHSHSSSHGGGARGDRDTSSSNRGGSGTNKSTTTPHSQSHVKDKPTCTSSSSIISKSQSSVTTIRTTTTSNISSGQTSSSSTEKSRLKPPPAVTGSSSHSKQGKKPESSIDSSEDGSGTGTDDEAVVVLPFDKFQLYEQVCQYEEAQAKELDMEEFTSNFLEDCQELENLVEFIYETRQNAKTKDDLVGLVNSEELNEIEDDCCLLVAQSRKNNRLMKLRLKAEKDALLEQRQTVDGDHLKLQNLLYEAIHLNKQIAAVKDYKSMDEKIDLVPLEEFYANAPASISKPEITKNDPHRLRIARLEYEFYQRRQLTKNCTKLEETKQKITEQIGTQKTKLNSLKPLLDGILEATVPVQKFFDTEFSSKTKMYKAANYLSPPLYALYVNTVGYKEYLDNSNFNFTIAGDLDAAKKLLKSAARASEEAEKNSGNIMEQDEDSDHDMDVDEDKETGDKEELSDRRALRKHASIIEEQHERQRKVLEVHPLHLEWIIGDGGNNNTLTIKFVYMTNLKIITVETAVNISELPELTQNLIKNSASTLLCDIYEHDDGASSPNPSTPYFLYKAGVDNFSDIVSIVGRPFMWAQKLCGLSFPKPDQHDDVDDMKNGEKDSENEDSDDDMHGTVAPHNSKQTMLVNSASLDSTYKIICRRFNCSQQLWNQLRLLESKTFSIPSELKDNFPLKNTTILSSWESISWDQYIKYTGSTSPIKFNLISNSRNKIYFKGTFERSRAKILALASISYDYPIEPPIFILQFDPSSNSFPTLPGDETVLREMEKEINLFTIQEFETWAPQILNLQIQKLIYCIDLFLETRADQSGANTEGPVEFGREKLFSLSSKGKNFRRPFQYVAKHGGHFTQRF